MYGLGIWGEGFGCLRSWVWEWVYSLGIWGLGFGNLGSRAWGCMGAQFEDVGSRV